MLSSTDESYLNSEENDENSEEICKDFDPLTFFKSQKQLCYYKIIHKFFRKCSKDLIYKMIDIINGESLISLRVLEWVVTKSGKNSININSNLDVNIESDSKSTTSTNSNTSNTSTKSSNSEYSSVNIMYKAQLKSYKKKNFDPFRRDKKFYFPYDKDDSTKTILTTLGQLNFFKWAISSNIIASVEKNYEQINKTMIHYNKEEKTKKVEKKKRKEKKKISIITSKKNNNLYMNTSILDESNKSNKSNKSNTTRTTESKERFMINFN
jgi:hypothetical protein